jgi:hypothetical protein
MIAWLAGVAVAQNSEFVSGGKDCPLPAAIYGTSGWANAEQAIDTNAVTYSAAAFAERLGLDQPPSGDRKTRGLVVWEVNETFNVARVPSFHGAFGQNYADDADCDPKYLVGLRPVDLQATLLAGVFGTEHFGGFFAATQTSGQVASVDPLMRLVYLGYLYPLYSTLSLPFSPFLAGEYRSGAEGIGLDAVYGLWVDSRWVMAKAGYTKSSGFYATARDTTVGLFATAVLRPGDGSVPVFRAGIQKLDPGKADEDLRNIGMPSLYYRDIPLAQPVGVDDAEGVEHQRLRTTHVEMEDIGRLVDLASAFRIRPEAGFSSGVAALHSKSYHLRDGDEPDKAAGFALAEAGVVTLLEQPSLGVSGGPVPAFRLETGFKGPKAAFTFHRQFNDAEQLALYPFARNALSVQYHVEITRW